MITLEKLQEALQHMQEAKRLVNEASKENHSLTNIMVIHYKLFHRN